MELVSTFFQPTLQEMFYYTMLKMRVMDVEQHHDYLRNIKVLILKVAEDCRALKEISLNAMMTMPVEIPMRITGVYSVYPS